MLDLAGGGAMQLAYLPLLFWKIFTFWKKNIFSN